MNQETLKQYVKKQGHRSRFDPHGWMISTEDMQLKVGKRFEEFKLTYDFRLTGPPPSDELMHELIAYGEEEDIELYFKHLQVSHVPLLSNEVSSNCFLISLLDT